MLPDDLMRPGAAAHLLGVHLATLYRYLDDGRLPFWWVGSRQRRVSRADVMALARRGKARRQLAAAVPSVAEVGERDRRTAGVLERLGLARYLPTGAR